ncbi:uncharacterized protein IL334_003067 [Kwoniella shivajii]|uniref:DNA topoisomerase (ATP-hydrolyzing) n=1 Tax=Kwoniella shivajii TaxID=564305 RepID=A0ABZ1CWI0_9TREE|nr:hypothetical protein IL334_003067 [Kwoniella shivajii]
MFDSSGTTSDHHSDTDTDTDGDNDEESLKRYVQDDEYKHGSLEHPIDLTQIEDEDLTQDISPPYHDGREGRTQRQNQVKRKRRIFVPSPSPPIHLSYLPYHNDSSQQIQVQNESQGEETSSYFGNHFEGAESDTQSVEEDNLPIIEEDDDDHHDNLQEDLLIPDRRHSLLSFTSHSLTHDHLRTQSQRKGKDEDEALFMELVRRTESKRRYEIVAQESNQSQIQVKTQESESVRRSRGPAETDTVLVESQDDGSRTKTLEFLGSIVTDFLTQLHSSQLILDSREEERYNKRNPQKKRRISDDSQEVLVEEEEEESEESQNLSQTEVGVKLHLKNRKTGNDQIISFPDDPLSRMAGQTSIDKITCIIRVVAVLYEAVCSRTVVTLRDIFYRDKALFKRQDVVDKLVDDLVATAGLKRRDFYVCASAKGLIAATSLHIHRRTGEEVRLSSTIASLIDPVERIDHLYSPNGVNWVLVVEKDAVFQTLCSAKLLEDTRLGPGVMITGKGFPDLATRQLVHLIAESYPFAKMYALVDADPHGISILSTYAFGSKNTLHSHDHIGLSLGDRIQWLGVKASDFKKLGIKYDDLLPLEKSDIQLAMRMLKGDTLPEEWKRELSQIIHLNRKAEIEIILESNSDYNSEDLLKDDNDYFYEGVSGHSHTDMKRKSKLVEYIVERIING